MKIKSVRISNILSFEYKDEINNCDKISFDDNLNIIIGPNGAGKSNFLEIVNQLFKNSLFQACTFNENQIITHQSNPTIDLHGTIQLQNRNFKLAKNNMSNKDVKKVKIEIGLSDNDKINLKFILKNLAKINSMSQKYTNHPVDFPIITETDIDAMNLLSLFFEDDGTQNQLHNVTNFNNTTEKFVSLYLQQFNFIQNLITIANKYDNENWVPLKNTFALISGYRNYDGVESNFQVGGIQSEELQKIKLSFADETTRSASSGEPLVFSYVRRKIGYSYHKVRTKHGTPVNKDPIELLDDPIFLSLNEILGKILNLQLYIHRPDDDTLTYKIDFQNKDTSKIINIAELSSGEKGIIHFIFSIYGYDLENGVMIIDEPELHLHPQMQQKYLDIIFKVIQEMELQFIIATHSPIFVNPKTIGSVHRFHIVNGFTKVEKPKINDPEKDLIHILSYTNSSKIFFGDNVILVEGPSDEYFYKVFLQTHKPKYKNIELLDIGGKSSYTMWKGFLTKYGISVSFIGDLDNIFDSGIEIVAAATKSSWESQYDVSSSGSVKISLDSEYKSSREYRIDLLDFVKNNLSAEWQSTKPKITAKYTDGIFVLQEGELEDYVGIVGKKKKLKKIIDFCKNNFQSWYDNKTNPKFIELESIFNNILS